jgi:hypothetical protein
LCSNQWGFDLGSKAATPAVRHFPGGADGREVTHAAQGILSTPVNDALSLNRLPIAEGFRFQEDCMVAAPAKTIEAPKPRGTAAKDDNV